MDKKIINLDKAAIEQWLKNGAQPTETVSKLLAASGVLKSQEVTGKTKKHLPKTKAQERLKEKAEAAAAAEEARKAAAEEPKPEETASE